ncbi:MAG TPA: hypothetical protein VK993_04240 [Chthoniobacterales bacterium]|nr:hypothetical protein [Chthoniobacterales bacterium]
MNTVDSLAQAISKWQRKHRMADDDPILAVLDLVRLQLQHARGDRERDDFEPPSFEDFRTTTEVLDRRSKAFVQQATELRAEMRQLSNNVFAASIAGKSWIPFYCLLQA